MRLRLDDPGSVDDLVGHLRKQGFFVVQHDQHLLEVQPLNPVSARYDQSRIKEALRDWRSAHEDVAIDEAP